MISRPTAFVSSASVSTADPHLISAREYAHHSTVAQDLGPRSWVLPCCRCAPTIAANSTTIRIVYNAGTALRNQQLLLVCQLPSPHTGCNSQQHSITNMERPTHHPPSFPSPSPATADTVLPHADIDPTQLANQARHLTLSAESSPPVRASSAAASPPSDCDSDDSAPRQPASCWIDGELPGTATASPPAPAAAAQPVPPASRGHACAISNVVDERQYAVEREEAADSWCGALVSGGPYHSPGSWSVQHGDAVVRLVDLPNEVLLHVLGFLDVPDLLTTSRVSTPLPCPAATMSWSLFLHRGCMPYSLAARFFGALFAIHIPIHNSARPPYRLDSCAAMTFASACHAAD